MTNTLGTFYKSMSGLTAYSNALDNLSNNVANLNTTGFKARDVFFEELGDNNPDAGDNADSAPNVFDGQGVRISGSGVRFTQGDLYQTGNATDIAINGDGFFILRANGEELYTRNGQFRLDDQGYLVDPKSGARVAMLDETGSLADTRLDLNGYNASVATTTIQIKGSLLNNADVGAKVPDDNASPLVLSVFDNDGQEHTVHVTFTKLSRNEWQADFMNEAGLSVAPPHTIEFNSVGTPILDDVNYTLSFEDYSVVGNNDVSAHLSSAGVVQVPAGGLNEVTPFALTTTDAQLIGRDDDSQQFLDGTGQFHFDGAYLVDENGLRVAAKSSDGKITDFNLKDLTQISAQKTATVSVEGVLDGNTVAGATGYYPPSDHDAISFQVIGESGNLVTLYMRFRKDNSIANRWSAIIADTPEKIVDGDLTNSATISNITFSNLISDGVYGLPTSTQTFDVTYATSSAETLNFKLDFSAQNGATGLSTSIASDAGLGVAEHSHDGRLAGRLQSFSFNEDGIAELIYSNGQTQEGPQLAVVQREGNAVTGVGVNFSQLSVSSTATASSVAQASNDGRASGQVQSFNFSSDGKITLVFSNGEEKEVGNVALALFNDETALQSVGNSNFRASDLSHRKIGKPGEGRFGTLASQNLEQSNVDLSKEFAEIIIVQRGYQASSQVLNVANKMIEELYNSVGGK